MLSAVARRRLQKDGDAPQTQRPLSLDREEATIKKRHLDANIGGSSPKPAHSKKQRRQPTPELTSSGSSEHGERVLTNQFSSLAAYVQLASEIGKIEDLDRGRVRAIVGQGKVRVVSVSTIHELTVAENSCHWFLPTMDQVGDCHDLWRGLISFRCYIPSLCTFFTSSTSYRGT